MYIQVKTFQKNDGKYIKQSNENVLIGAFYFYIDEIISNVIVLIYIFTKNV